MSDNKPLVMGQPLADLMIVKSLLDTIDQDANNKKYLRAQAAYHLQQACEKLIKIQIYESGKIIRNDKLYKHSLSELEQYANELNIDVQMPAYIKTNIEVITSWEAQGRYDVHMVVRKDRLLKTYEETNHWFQELKEKGYK